jgi:DNA-binding transcriptional LysR family regulator
MPKIVQWEQQIGRRLRLRDLFVLFTVIKKGSMAKAASELSVSTPAVSEIIADLEHALGVRLLDRSPQGIVATVYGEALLRRGETAFDELKQGVRDIEFLADPTSGEIRVASTDSLAITILPDIIKHFGRQHPRVVLHLDTMPSPAIQLPGLRDRKYDLVFARSAPHSDDPSIDDLSREILFHDQMVIATGSHTRWASRRKIDLAELANEPWIMPAPDTWTYSHMSEAFRLRGIDMPKASLVTIAWPLVADFLADGQFMAVCARSVARRYSLKELPVDLPIRPWPVLIVKLKHRTLCPVVERFIDSAREVTRVHFAIGQAAARDSAP